jgi:fido (protein-threonine AMPylation protein)
LQTGGRRVFESRELGRIDRERLLQAGFLRPALKGWLLSSSLDTEEGDSTPWHALFWEFCARYCEKRFKDRWHLSPEQSLQHFGENTVTPPQVVVYSPRGTNNAVDLPFGSSIYDLRVQEMPHAAELVVRDGLRMFAPGAALARVSEAFFVRSPIEAEVALKSIRDASEILRPLLSAGRAQAAGRLAGAFRRLEKPRLADEILVAMKAAGSDVRETDPFDEKQVLELGRAAVPPIVTRLRAMWRALRGEVLAVFPRAPGLPRDSAAWLKQADHSYKSDAYNSLSIEGYRVTPELIERVASATNWDAQRNEADRKSRDALAARGYWQTFQMVKKSISQILAGKSPAAIVRSAHSGWYRELFEPCVVAGLLPAEAFAGYRNDAVFLRTSRYVPPRWEAVRDAMPALFDLLEDEAAPSVRAVLGHWLFGYLHPYPDGNGRVARFLMNAMLASGGYSWTVIRVEDREKYLRALDAASIEQKIEPFARFIAGCVKRSASSGTGRRQTKS